MSDVQAFDIVGDWGVERGDHGQGGRSFWPLGRKERKARLDPAKTSGRRGWGGCYRSEGCRTIEATPLGLVDELKEPVRARD